MRSSVSRVHCNVRRPNPPSVRQGPPVGAPLLLARGAAVAAARVRPDIDPIDPQPGPPLRAQAAAVPPRSCRSVEREIFRQGCGLFQPPLACIRPRNNTPVALSYCGFGPVGCRHMIAVA